ESMRKIQGEIISDKTELAFAGKAWRAGCRVASVCPRRLFECGRSPRLRFGFRCGNCRWRGIVVVAMLAVGPLLVGCEAPRRLVTFAPGAVPVVYEPATSYSECLVAGVAMAANYLEDSQRFTAEKISAELRTAGGDETKVADLKAYLAERGLHLLVLAGRM